MVQLMGADIVVESKETEGSCFSFMLELAITAEENKICFSAITPDLNILLVDDELVNLDVVAQLLSSEGHHVVKVASGTKALSVFQQQSFDIVLLDIGLPDISGIDVMAKMRKCNLAYTPPIIAYTASLLKTDIDNYIHLGMDDILPKPLQLESFAKYSQTAHY